MKRKITKKTVKQENVNTCSWFDTENARLIIFCALFGIFGVHKFAQKKIFQGICFILLDLTIIGLIISWLWAWFGLIALTVKKDNKPGNMIFGSVFIWISILSISMGVDSFMRTNDKVPVKETADVEMVSNEQKLGNVLADWEQERKMAKDAKQEPSVSEKIVKIADLMKQKEAEQAAQKEHGSIKPNSIAEQVHGLTGTLGENPEK